MHYRFSFILFFTFCHSIYTFTAFAKKTSKNDYRNYYKQIIIAESFFVNDKRDSAFATYNQIFANKQYKPFLFDLYNATQFAYINGDTVLFLKYLRIAADNGLTVDRFFIAPIFRSIRNRPKSDHLANKINTTFKEAYFKTVPIDKQSLDKFYERKYFIDSSYYQLSYLNAPNAGEVLGKLEYDFRMLIDSIFLSKGQFPSEKILGLRSNNKYKQFTWPDEQPIQVPSDLWDVDTTNIGNILTLYSVHDAYFLHNSCSFEKYGDKIWQAVLNGYIPPKEYALIEEGNIFKRFGARHNQNNVDSCNYDIKPTYYNVLHPSNYPNEMQQFIATKEGLAMVEANRAKHFIRKYSDEQKLIELQIKYGLKLMHGFLRSW